MHLQPTISNKCRRARERPHWRIGEALRRNSRQCGGERQCRLQHHGAERDGHQGRYYRICTLHKALSFNSRLIGFQISAAQGLSSLIRELQELWLFGGLDTLTDPADEKASEAKALGIAAMIEVLAKRPPAPRRPAERER